MGVEPGRIRTFCTPYSDCISSSFLLRNGHRRSPEGFHGDFQANDDYLQFWYRYIPAAILEWTQTQHLGKTRKARRLKECSTRNREERARESRWV